MDTNSAYIARALRDIGVNVYYKTTVGDNIERMALVLRLALGRADVVIVTGGLGPTVDDVTREAVVAVTGRELVLHPECLAAIETLFARWGRPVADNNRRQAYLPAGDLGGKRQVVGAGGANPVHQATPTLGIVAAVGEQEPDGPPAVLRDLAHPAELGRLVLEI